MTKRMQRVTSVFGLTALCLLLALGYGQAAGDLSPSEARKLIANMAGIKLPSNAVRVREVSPMGTSALVVAQVETAFRFVKSGDGKWRVAEIRTGDNRWEDIETLLSAVNSEKAGRARAELETLATALEAFRRERGFYVVATDERGLVDHLNPRYLARVIRVDPWHNPYLYEGTRTSYTLRSAGADGKENTPDDVIRRDEGGGMRDE
ncbi:MAG TPA: type II secretion system protein GspG [Pyrinomonadaceae bacterium]|nr:type II secretion system protein GspG [Pyrinomonadaceae bacterium]